MLGLARGYWGLHMTNSSATQKFVIPAQARTQSFVHSKITNGLGPGLRRGDEFFTASLILLCAF